MKFKHLISLYLGTICTAVAFSSCNKSPIPIPDAVPVQLDGESVWSLMTLDGEIIAENEFESTPSVAFNDRFIVSDEDGYYVHDISNPIAPLNDEGFTNLTNFNSGYAYGVRKGTGILLVDHGGNVIKELPDSIVTVYSDSYNPESNLLVYSDYDRKKGYITPTGEIAILAQWEEALPFSEGIAIVKNKNNRWICINEKGDVIFKLKAKDTPQIAQYKNGWITINNDNRNRIIDKNGEVICKLKSEQNIISLLDNNRTIVYSQVDGYLLIKNIDIDNGERIKKFHSIIPIGNNGKRYISKKSTESDWIIINENGEKVGDSRFEKIESTLLDYGLILASENYDDPYQLYDCNGNLLDKNMEINSAMNTGYSTVHSLNAYNKNLTNKILELFNNHHQFGGKHNTPAIADSTSAQQIFTGINFTALDVLNHQNTIWGNEIFNKPIELDESSNVYFYIYFSRNPLNKSGFEYSFSDAKAKMCVISLDAPTEEHDATILAIAKNLQANGWKQSSESSLIFDSDNGHQIYVRASEYGNIAIFYAFYKRDPQLWLSFPSYYEISNILYNINSPNLASEADEQPYIEHRPYESDY